MIRFVGSWDSKYYKAGTIKIYEPRMGTYGSVLSDKALMHINLVDIAKFSGHLCGGSTSGFMMTKLALESLYRKGETPGEG
jgi:formylmethanofuran dehydrogenase subunit E-like metal-binding protein